MHFTQAILWSYIHIYIYNIFIPLISIIWKIQSYIKSASDDRSRPFSIYIYIYVTGINIYDSLFTFWCDIYREHCNLTWGAVLRSLPRGMKCLSLTCKTRPAPLFIERHNQDAKSTIVCPKSLIWCVPLLYPRCLRVAICNLQFFLGIFFYF